jgi:chemotaxis signal transduction protein
MDQVADIEALLKRLSGGRVSPQSLLVSAPLVFAAFQESLRKQESSNSNVSVNLVFRLEADEYTVPASTIKRVFEAKSIHRVGDGRYPVLYVGQEAGALYIAVDAISSLGYRRKFKQTPESMVIQPNNASNDVLAFVVDEIKGFREASEGTAKPFVFA